MQFKPIAVNNPQRDSVYNQLKDAILDGTIKPGEKISMRMQMHFLEN